MRALFERDHWANQRLLDFCSHQPAEVLTGASGDDVLGPVDVQLPHLVFANPIFIRWVTGLGGPDEPAEGRSMHNLDTPMRWVEEQWLGALDFDRDPEAHYQYPRRSGPPADMTGWKALLQYLHHGDDHRNQVATVLSRHGVEPPELDLWSFGEAVGFERADTDAGRPEWRSAILRRAFGHHEWATEKLLSACMELSPEQLALTAPGTYGSILDTLDHMISSNRSYLSRLQGTGRKAPLHAGALAPLQDEFRRTAEGWLGYLDSRPDFDARVDMRDGTRVGAWVIVAQAIHHGNDHRTHVTTTMSHNGLPFPHLDPWEYAVAVDAQEVRS